MHSRERACARWRIYPHWRDLFNSGTEAATHAEAHRLASVPAVPVSAVMRVEPRPPTMAPMLVSQVPRKSWASKFWLLPSLRWSKLGAGAVAGRWGECEEEDGRGS